MELSQLETFLAVAEEHSFSRAAVRLRRTQPAVSQVIRKLEASVGETLFRPGGAGRIADRGRGAVARLRPPFAGLASRGFQRAR
jgi:DNA-binding transcriptional LysR family regulator